MKDDLARLAYDLRAVAVTSPVVVRAVVAKGALNIKNDARQRASGIRHAPMYPYTITYDTTETPWGVSAEIGPDKDKVVGGGPYRTPGNLGAILEYGTSRSAPIPHLAPALDAEEPRFLDALADAAEKALDE